MLSVLIQAGGLGLWLMDQQQLSETTVSYSENQYVLFPLRQR